MAMTGGSDGTGAVPRDPDKPPSYFVSSILVTLFCCLPFGIVAIVYGLQVQTRWRAGDERGATHASDMAEKWMYGGIGAWILLAIGSAIYWFFLGRNNGDPLDGMAFAR
jgi:hypothetical protein